MCKIIEKEEEAYIFKILIIDIFKQVMVFGKKQHLENVSHLKDYFPTIT